MRRRNIFSVGDSLSTITSENRIYILKGADGLPHKMAAQEGQETENIQDPNKALLDNLKNMLLSVL